MSWMREKSHLRGGINANEVTPYRARSLEERLLDAQVCSFGKGLSRSLLSADSSIVHANLYEIAKDVFKEEVDSACVDAVLCDCPTEEHALVDRSLGQEHGTAMPCLVLRREMRRRFTSFLAGSSKNSHNEVKALSLQLPAAQFPVLVEVVEDKPSPPLKCESLNRLPVRERGV